MSGRAMKSTTEATLFNTIYRATFRKETLPGWHSNVRMRQCLQDARRFVLDESMSRFLADLANASFQNKPISIGPRLCEQMRVSARLPHKAVWFEYNLRAEMERVNEIWRGSRDDRMVTNHGKPLLDPTHAPFREGWLMTEHPKVDTGFCVHLFNEADYEDEDGFRIYTFPVCYAWTSDESPLPWNYLVNPATVEVAGKLRSSSEVYTGVTGYHTHRLAIVESDLIANHFAKNKEAVDGLVHEWTGVMRRVWALLMTINDIPTTVTDVRTSKGFFARGKVRKFLDHKTLTLHVPQKVDRIKIARNLVAMARRRAHDVRGHWRLDFNKPGDKLHAHEWQSDQTCPCGAHRFWIREHQRGDASLGFVTHSYNVKHETENAE